MASSQGGFDSDPFQGKDNNFGAFGGDNFGEQSRTATGFDDSFGSAFNGNVAAAGLVSNYKVIYISEGI